jgi:hypothetical protein
VEGLVGRGSSGIEVALEQARQAAGGRDVLLGGGASVVQQCLAAGLVDEFWLYLVPVLLGAGERLLEHVGDLKVEQFRAIEAPGVAHITYRVVKEVACAGGQSAGSPVRAPSPCDACLTHGLAAATPRQPGGSFRIGRGGGWRAG